MRSSSSLTTSGCANRRLPVRAKIDHRTPDVVEVLGEDEYTALTLLRYLPGLDVVSTAPLRDAAQKGCTANSRKSIAPEDDPRPYQELLLRLGDGVQFPALKWLPEHACGAETELGEADTLLRAYQDSSDRAAMLATLADCSASHSRQDCRA